jgi:hypothetical protein
MALFAAPASAHRVPKTFQCVPIEGTPGSTYDKSCQVWWANGEFAGSCDCEPGFVLFDPINSLLTIQDGGSSGGGKPPKASGS